MVVTIEQLTESGTCAWLSFHSLPPFPRLSYLIPPPNSLPSPFLLSPIGVGQVVKGLRKHAEADIQAKAKAAFTRWKENFKQQDAQPAADGEAENKKKKKVKAEDEKDEAPAAPSAPQPVLPSPQKTEAAASDEEGKG